jgi:hypothetical protein
MRLVVKCTMGVEGVADGGYQLTLYVHTAVPTGMASLARRGCSLSCSRAWRCSTRAWRS